MTASARRYFANDYAEARGLFLQAAKAAGATLGAVEHPLKGPGGEALFMDIAALGDPAAKNLLVVTSGVHGVEGFCGSACQVAMLENGIRPQASTALILVHAMNPFGFAHLRRTNEDNIDLNRNFVVHPLVQADSAYAALHDLLLPGDWDGPQHIAADAALLAMMQVRGVRAVYADAARGQYSRPEGLFFGGEAPSWSNRTWRALLQRQLKGRDRVVHLDLHSGLGPLGYGELLFIDSRDTPAFAALRSWVTGDISPIREEGSVAPPADGTATCAVREAADAGALVMLCALEFGTVAQLPVLRAMRADAWLNTHDADPVQARALRAEVKSAFCVDDDYWRSTVVEQALERTSEILAGLAR